MPGLQVLGNVCWRSVLHGRKCIPDLERNAVTIAGMAASTALVSPPRRLRPSPLGGTFRTAPRCRPMTSSGTCAWLWCVTTATW
eukprot:361095-Chlamydomonas_euryale.AAC.5